MAIELTTEKFDEFIKKGTVLIDFHAHWCMPCVIMSPIVDEIGKKFRDKLKVGKINVDENHEIAQKYNVRSIPTFILFKDGKIKEQFVGAVSKEKFEEEIKKRL
ncbi:thioredoxin [Candidatus Woesearchaeota archaeon]|nr:thioredoxin [Candidatus Woesearchaeota archaeon]